MFVLLKITESLKLNLILISPSQKKLEWLMKKIHKENKLFLKEMKKLQNNRGKYTFKQKIKLFKKYKLLSFYFNSFKDLSKQLTMLIREVN